MRRNLRPTFCRAFGRFNRRCLRADAFSDAEGQPEDERSVVREKWLDAGK
jgi:hypothetical protein